jgi:hypothetical protein
MERGRPCPHCTRRALIVNNFRRRLKMFHAPAHQRHVRAGFGERARDPARDAGATAGDESNVIFKNSVCEN